jgi:NADH-quinone oxidoreductase subunit J
MMLFLFILMLVGVDTSDSLKETIRGQRATAITATVGLGGLLISLIGRATIGHPAVGLATANYNGNVQSLAEQLFTKYVWAFEVVSALLITAALGAMVLAHSSTGRSRTAQRDQAIARFRGDSLAEAAGLPAPGVFSRHNAVDVPALLPDGKPAAASVSRVLEARGDVIESKIFELESREAEEE